MGTRHLYWILTGPSFAVRTKLQWMLQLRGQIHSPYLISINICIYVYSTHAVSLAHAQNNGEIKSRRPWQRSSWNSWEEIPLFRTYCMIIEKKPEFKNLVTLFHLKWHRRHSLQGLGLRILGYRLLEYLIKHADTSSWLAFYCPLLPLLSSVQSF